MSTKKKQQTKTNNKLKPAPIPASGTGSIEKIDLGLINLHKAEFYVADGGFTGLRYDGADYKHITLKRALPVSRPMDYVSVYDRENKEVGIIKDITELKGRQLAVVIDELNSRYYCPDILEVKSVKDKLGYIYMELRISGGAAGGKVSDSQGHVKSCAIKDVNRNIRMLDDNSLIIFDVDGNRYIVRSLAELDKNSVKKLEPFMF
jgi:hypothetical protein